MGKHRKYKGRTRTRLDLPRVGVKGGLNYSFNVNTNQLNAWLASTQQRLESVSVDALWEVAQMAKEFAEDKYADAKYDGEHDARVLIDKSTHTRTVTIDAIGDSVNFIEYGTGVGRGKDGKWFFSAKGRDIQCTATGHPTSYYRGGYTKTRYYYTGPKGGKHYIDPDFFWDMPENIADDDINDYIRRDSNWNPIEISITKSLGGLGDSRTMGTKNKQKFKRTNYSIQTETRHVPSELVVRDDGSYETEGNPPQFIMFQTKEYIREIAPEIVKKHLGKVLR